MGFRNMYMYRRFHVVAQETQLLAEERWILNTLGRIKQQRNSVQIEKLQLESLKTQITDPQHHVNEKPVSIGIDRATLALHSTINEMTNTALALQQGQRKIEQLFKPEADCNLEQLNLQVTEPVLREWSNRAFSEEEESETEDEADESFVMNIFINNNDTNDSI